MNKLLVVILLLTSINSWAKDSEKCLSGIAGPAWNQLDLQVQKVHKQLIQQDELEGDYKLISGPKECPTGTLQTKIDKKNQERVLLFGSRHSWNLNMSDNSETMEVVEDDCTYLQKYEKKDISFVSKTSRSKCLAKADEGVVLEKIILKNIDLSYEFDFKKTHIKCQYKKVIKS